MYMSLCMALIEASDLVWKWSHLIPSKSEINHLNLIDVLFINYWSSWIPYFTSCISLYLLLIFLSTIEIYLWWILDVSLTGQMFSLPSWEKEVERIEKKWAIKKSWILIGNKYLVILKYSWFTDFINWLPDSYGW